MTLPNFTNGQELFADSDPFGNPTLNSVVTAINTLSTQVTTLNATVASILVKIGGGSTTTGAMSGTAAALSSIVGNIIGPGGPSFTESASGTTVTTVGPVITDSKGNTYSLTAGGQILENATLDPVTSGVITLLYYAHIFYQNTNNGSGWWTQSAPNIPAGSAAWTQMTGDPRTGGTPIGGGTSATVLYVSTTGNDTSGTGASGAPFATIGRAASIAVPGTTINVAAGTYAGGFDTTSSGTTGNLISYVGTNAIVKGGTVTTGAQAVVWRLSGSYCRIQGFTLDGASSPQAAGLLYVTGGNNIVQGNTFQNYLTVLAQFNAQNTAGGGAIVLNDAAGATAYGNSVIGNTIQNVGPASGSVSTTVHGIWNNSQNSTIQNNLVRNVIATGIQNAGDVSGSHIANNTVVACGYGIIVSGSGGPTAANVVVANNIVADNVRGIAEQGTTAASNIYANNLVWNNTSYNYSLQNSLTPTASVFADPQFISRATFNFQIQTASPAVGSGSATYMPAADILNATRNANDIGAYQPIASGTGVTPVSNVSAQGAIVTTVGPTLIDVYGNTYALNSSAQVTVNGTADTSTSAATELEFWNAQVYYKKVVSGVTTWWTQPSPNLSTNKWTSVAGDPSSTSTGTGGVPFGTGPDPLALPRAQALADMVRIDAEIKKGNGEYGTNIYSDWTKMRTAMQFMNNGGRGMWIIRENLRQPAPSILAAYIPAMNSAGFRFCFDIDWDNGTTNNWNALGTTAMQTYISSAYAVEGGNEVQNGFGGTPFDSGTYTSKNGSVYSGTQCSTQLQIDLWNTFHSSVTEVVPYSLGNENSTATCPEIAYGNSIGYPIGSISNTSMPLHVYCNFGYPMGNSDNNRMDGVVAENCSATGGYGGTPIVATEYGYCSGSPTWNAQGNNYGNPMVNARYIIDDMIYSFNKKCQGMYIYELGDILGPANNQGNPDACWGRFDINGNAYQDATALRFWFGIFGDTGLYKRTFFPGRFSYTVSGLPRADSCIVVTQRSDGAVHLHVNPNIAFYKGISLQTITSTNVTITFTQSYSTINVYDPATASDSYNTSNWASAPVKPAPRWTYSNQNYVTLALNKEPLIVEILGS